jgi:hypothetical protein
MLRLYAHCLSCSSCSSAIYSTTLSVSRLTSDAVEKIQKERSWHAGGTIWACAWTDWEPWKHFDSRRIGPDSKRTPPTPPNKASRLSYLAQCFHYCFVCQPLPIAAYNLTQLCLKYLSTQGCTNPGRHVAVATIFCTVALTVCESSLSNLLHVTIPILRILRCTLGF